MSVDFVFNEKKLFKNFQQHDLTEKIICHKICESINLDLEKQKRCTLILNILESP
jgi:hypothetical protein